MAKQAFEKKLEALQALGASDLRKALTDQNNFYVGKAARRAASIHATELIEPLVEAFHRFRSAPDTDPQCWAKLGILLALHDLGHRDPGVYMSASRCVQLENVRGGKEDSAPQLRAQALLALLESTLDPVQLLRTILPGLTDPAKIVRLESIRALGQLGRWEGELLIRQKALAGDAIPEVLGTAYSAILDLDQQGAVEFVAGFLDSEDENAQLEAAASLAQSHHEEAFEVIMKLWRKVLTLEMTRTILISLGTSSLDEARDLLVDIIRRGSIEEAIYAVTALATGRHREEMRDTVSALVAERQDRQLSQAFREEFN